MNVCTAVGAIDSKKNYTITFKSEAHKIFYLKYLPECRYQDVYHKALVYCLGIDADTRNHVNSIYDFKTGCVKTKCLNEGWQNSGSIKIVRMAFNLYCNGTPSVHDFGNAEERLQDADVIQWKNYSVVVMQNIFGRQSKSGIRNIAAKQDWRTRIC